MVVVFTSANPESCGVVLALALDLESVAGMSFNGAAMADEVVLL